MAGISIPLPLSPATKLLMDCARLTGSYSDDKGFWAPAQALQGHLGALSHLGRKMESSCSWLSGVSWSVQVTAQEPQNLTCAVLHWCPGPRQGSQLVCVHPRELRTLDMQFLSYQKSTVSLVSCLPSWSSSAHESQHYPDVISSCTTRKKLQTGQNECKYTLPGEIRCSWKCNWWWLLIVVPQMLSCFSSPSQEVQMPSAVPVLDEPSFIMR